MSAQLLLILLKHANLNNNIWFCNNITMQQCVCIALNLSLNIKTSIINRLCKKTQNNEPHSFASTHRITGKRNHTSTPLNTLGAGRDQSRCFGLAWLSFFFLSLQSTTPSLWPATTSFLTPAAVDGKSSLKKPPLGLEKGGSRVMRTWEVTYKCHLCNSKDIRGNFWILATSIPYMLRPYSIMIYFNSFLWIEIKKLKHTVNS